MLYDSLLSFPTEVEIVLKSRLTRAKAAYMLYRYLMVFSVLLYLCCWYPPLQFLNMAVLVLTIIECTLRCVLKLFSRRLSYQTIGLVDFFSFCIFAMRSN